MNFFVRCLFIFIFYILLPGYVLYERYSKADMSASETNLADFGFDTGDNQLASADKTNFFEKYKGTILHFFSIFAYFFVINQFATGVKPKFLVNLFGGLQNLIRFHIVISILIVIFMLIHAFIKIYTGSTIELLYLFMGLMFLTITVIGLLFWVKTKALSGVFTSINKYLKAKGSKFFTNYLKLKYLHFTLNIIALLLLYIHIYKGLEFADYIAELPRANPIFYTINIHFIFMLLFYIIFKSINDKKIKKIKE